MSMSEGKLRTRARSWFLQNAVSQAELDVIIYSSVPQTWPKGEGIVNKSKSLHFQRGFLWRFSFTKSGAGAMEPVCLYLTSDVRLDKVQLD